ncbi:MAG: hypothetical protein K2K00_10995 [Muribaculaceae bacterium]|nr:hypothetical protein [Muribaculaceae bacterium]MDE6704185.1 hypothetical protein [Muribaculaceae bacterium]
MIKEPIHIYSYNYFLPFESSLEKQMKNSFFSGIGSVFAVPGNYNLPELMSPSHDKAMLRHDWEFVGDELTRATKKFQLTVEDNNDNS